MPQSKTSKFLNVAKTAGTLLGSVVLMPIVATLGIALTVVAIPFIFTYAVLEATYRFASNVFSVKNREPSSELAGHRQFFTSSPPKIFNKHLDEKPSTRRNYFSSYRYKSEEGGHKSEHEEPRAVISQNTPGKSRFSRHS